MAFIPSKNTPTGRKLDSSSQYPYNDQISVESGGFYFQAAGSIVIPAPADVPMQGAGNPAQGYPVQLIINSDPTRVLQLSRFFLFHDQGRESGVAPNTAYLRWKAVFYPVAGGAPTGGFATSVPFSTNQGFPPPTGIDSWVWDGISTPDGLTLPAFTGAVPFNEIYATDSLIIDETDGLMTPPGSAFASQFFVLEPVGLAAGQFIRCNVGWQGRYLAPTAPHFA